MNRTTTIFAVLIACASASCDSDEGGADAASASATDADDSAGATGEASTTDATGDESGGETGTGDGTGGSGTTTPDTQDPELAELTDDLNASCGTEIITTIDWDSYIPNYGEGPQPGGVYGEREVVNYCAAIVGEIEFVCRQYPDFKANFVEVGLVQIHCYWHPDLPKEGDTRENMIMEISPDGIQTWGMNWWTLNVSSQVFEWLRAL